MNFIIPDKINPEELSPEAFDQHYKGHMIGELAGMLQMLFEEWPEHDVCGNLEDWHSAFHHLAEATVAFAAFSQWRQGVERAKEIVQAYAYGEDSNGTDNQVSDAYAERLNASILALLVEAKTAWPEFDWEVTDIANTR